MGKGKEKDKDKGKEPQKEQKKPDQKPQKRSLKAKLVRLLVFLAFVTAGSGVGHFYWKEKRWPKDGQDAKIILQNISTFFIFTTNVAKENWKKLGLEDKANNLVKGFEKLLQAKKPASSSSPNEPKAASMKADPTYSHILKSKEQFEEGKKFLRSFSDTRNQGDLGKAKAAFHNSREHLEKARAATSDAKEQEAIEEQMSEVGKFIEDCNKMGNM